MSSDLLKAVESNNIEQVKSIINDRFKFTKKNSPLGLAVEKANFEIVKLLVNAGCNVEWGGDLMPPPLCLASDHGDLKIVDFLIDNKANLNVKDDGFTPLMIAASKGYIKVVKSLVSAGAKVNIESDHGDFALNNAISNGHRDIYNYLLPLTAPKLIKKIDSTLIKSASKNQSVNLKKLIDVISEVNYIKEFHISKDTNGEMKQINKLICKINDHQSTDLNGLTALHHAVSNSEILAILLEDDFIHALNIQDNEGNTPLISACTAKQVEAVSLLLNAGAETEIKNRQGNTALLQIVGYPNSKDIVKLLCDAGADLEAKDEFGNTAIEITYTYSKYRNSPEDFNETTKLLESLGASKSRFPQIDFIESIIDGNQKSVVDFIRNGGNINCLGVNGISALKAAAIHNKIDLLKSILSHNADLHKILDGFDISIRRGHIEVIKELINAGIDVNTPNPNDGSFPLSRAVEKKNIAMVETLLEAGARIPKKDPVLGDVIKLAKLISPDIYSLLTRQK